MDYAKLTYANLDICTVEKQYICIYMHILDTTYWYLDLVSITYFVYIVHTVHVYIYIYTHTCRPRNHSSSNNRLGCWENPPPLPQGGGTIWLGGEGCGGPCSYIYIYIIDKWRATKALKPFVNFIDFAFSWGRINRWINHCRVLLDWSPSPVKVLLLALDRCST